MIDQPDKTAARAAVIVYVAAFIVGAIVMSFEMLGSRYLNPYFGSGIYTWAALISTVLAALCVGYFLGGWLADRMPSIAVLGATVIVGSAYVLLIPAVADRMLDLLLAGIDDVRNGSLVASFALLFFPVTLLGMYSPFAIRLLLHDPKHSGRVSGTVYGINTLGSIVGTLATTFYLIPLMGSRAITLSLGIGGIVAGLVLIAASATVTCRSPALLLAGIAQLTASVAFVPGSFAEDLSIWRCASKCSRARTVRSTMSKLTITTSSFPRREIRIVDGVSAQGLGLHPILYQPEGSDDLPLALPAR